MKKDEKIYENELKGLNEQEKKEYKEVINKYDLDKLFNFNLNGFALRGELNTPENILRDLKKLPKTVTEEVGDSIYLKSKNEILHFGYLEFIVELRYDLPKKGFVTVYLILKEPVKKAGGLFIDYNQETIAHLILPNDINLFIKIADEFNIAGVLGGRSRIETDYEPVEIVRAKRYLYVLAGHVVYATCAENRRFLEGRINILKNSEIGRRILQEFNNLLPFIQEQNLNYEQSIFAQNQLLTNIIRQFEELFSRERHLFMNLTLLSAEYRRNINHLSNEIAHHITLDNYESFTNIPRTSNEEHTTSNVQFDEQEELTRER